VRGEALAGDWPLHDDARLSPAQLRQLGGSDIKSG
jgi:hypothetical protein